MPSLFSSNPQQSTQTQNSTTTAAPWSAATPLLQNLINSYGVLNTNVTPQQTQAGQQLSTAAQSAYDAANYALPYAYNMVPASAGLIPAAQQVAGSTGNLAPAAQNVINSTAPMTGAAYGEIPASYAQFPAAYNLLNASQGVNALAPQSTAAVQNLFANAGMIPSAYANTMANLSPYAAMSANPYQTPGFSDALNTLTQNITSQVQGAYAGSGREPSGAGTMPQTLARGLMQGEAPVIAGQYNTNLGNIMSANQILQNAGISSANAMSGNTLSALSGAGLLPSLQMAPATAQWNAAQAPLTAAQNIYGASQAPYNAAMTQYGANLMPFNAAQTNYTAAGYPLQAATTQLGAAGAPGTVAQNAFTAAQSPYNVASLLYGTPYQNLLQALSPALALGGAGGTTTAQGQATGTIQPAQNAASNIMGLLSGGAGILGSLGQAGGAGGIGAFGSSLASGLGSLGSTLMSLLPLSEREMKTDIKKVGETHDKQNIYSFRFKGSGVPQIGMMADEVEKKHPEAVVRDPSGFRRVNYDLATRKAATMGLLSAKRAA